MPASFIVLCVRTRAHLDNATNVGIRGRSAGLRPGCSGAGAGNAAGPEAGAPVVVPGRGTPDTRSQVGFDPRRTRSRPPGMRAETQLNAHRSCKVVPPRFIVTARHEAQSWSPPRLLHQYPSR